MNNHKTYRQGLSCALLCSILWGVLPIYWDALEPIDSLVIILYRVSLMALLCLFCCWHRYGLKNTFRPMFESPKKFFTYVIAGVVVVSNWSIYVAAVRAGYVIQTSMGYFLEPLIICLLGMLFYREKINGMKKTALVFAGIGVLVLVIGYRQLPMIALGLAVTFSAYAAIKKSVALDPLQSMLFETIFLLPVMLLGIVRMESAGHGALAIAGPGKYALLLLSGIVTAVPMGLFSSAANKLPLVTLGLTEYICPSLSLVLGIFLFHEPFDRVQLISFVLVWIGLMFFTWGEVRDQKTRSAPQKPARAQSEPACS